MRATYEVKMLVERPSDNGFGPLVQEEIVEHVYRDTCKSEAEAVKYATENFDLYATTLIKVISVGNGLAL